MQVSVETLEGLQRKMTVQLPAEKVNEIVDNKLRTIAKQVRLDGFRPGKVPLLSLIHISEPTRQESRSRMPSSA